MLKNDKNLEDTWVIGDESWRERKHTYHIQFTYYANAEDEKNGWESTYEYVIRFDETEGFQIKSEGLPENQ